ncbi:hypothetical protein BGZ99_003917, partial [Dissophora globulifera]
DWKRVSDSLPQGSPDNTVQAGHHPSLHGGGTSDRERGLGTPRKESHRARFGSWFPKSTVHHRQEDWRPPPSSQPASSQPVRGTRVIQDGDSEDGMLHAPEERFSNVHRSQGRISSCADRSISPQIPSVCVEGS